MADLKYVTGLDALKAALLQLPANIGKNVLRGAASRGAEVIKERAIDLAPSLQKVDRHKNPRVKGLLKAAVYQKQIPELSNDLLQTFFVGVREGKQRGKFQYAVKTSAGGFALVDAFYWKWVEFGHFYVPPRPRNATTGKLVKQSWHREQVKASANAVFVKPQPFLRPAYNEKSAQALQIMVDYMSKRIRDEAKKLGFIVS
jgi:HK97 gp10 family phage protein